MADSGKKRKRPNEQTSKPNKKVAFQSQSPTNDVSVSLIQATDEWAPVVVSTPGLTIPSSVGFQPYFKQRKNAPQQSGRSGGIAADELLLQSSAHSQIDYTGREDGTGDAKNLLKHYVGVYEPSTGKLRVMEARKMVVRGAVRSKNAPPEAFTSRGSATNMRDMRNDLGETFGTKKARKAIASLVENAILPPTAARQASAGGTERMKLDSVSTAFLESMAEATEGMATRGQLSAAVDAAKPRPRANLEATAVKDVYPVQDLIGNDIMKLLQVKTWQDSVTAKKEIVTKSKFVAHRLTKVATDVQKLKVLQYLLCLLEFYGSTTLKGHATRKVPQREKLRAAMPSVPDAVVEHIRQKFSTKGDMRKFQTDLLITHACALACIVDNFEVDLYDLREDLNLESKQIGQYFREIGAKVTPANEAQRKDLGLDKAAARQRTFAKLKLPLDFPKAKFARKQR